MPLKFQSGLKKEVNGESRGHPISIEKYNLYFYCSEIQLFIFHGCEIQLFLNYALYLINKFPLSYDVASGSEITPCNKIDKPLVVYRFTGNVLTSITTLRT